MTPYPHGPELHAISTGRQKPEVLIRIASAIHPYVTAIHVREKTCSPRELWTLLAGLSACGVPPGKLVVNDRADAASLSGAGGVQLPGSGLPASAVKKGFPGLRVGVSVHGPGEAGSAAGEGADYVLFGHIFATGSKPGAAPRGTEALRETVLACAGLPVIAIGGIHPGNCAEVMRAGAAGVAVMSGIWEAENPAEAAKRYRHELDFARQREKTGGELG
ncbi:thiamine phosphate synthase [Paenibacillus sp. 1P03SA]|uniref:thiamine phosphate synthase n=1 Tax=Paenibacillus sp. 1P03SA TaxID=3132294 RepID=UPI0039A1E60A